MELKEIQSIILAAKTNLLNSGHLLPVCHIISDGKATIVGFPDLGPETKKGMWAMAGALAIKEGAEMIVFTTESWYLSVPKETGIPELPPSQHPDRQEAISIIGIHVDPKKNFFATVPFFHIKDSIVFKKETITENCGDSIQGTAAAIFRKALELAKGGKL